MGECRTWMGKKRQLAIDEMSIYTNKPVCKKFKNEHYADYDNAIGSSLLVTTKAPSQDNSGLFLNNIWRKYI